VARRMILDHPVVSQAWTCQTAWRHLEVPSGGSQGVQRGAYPWLLQGAHKGYRGEPTPGSFRGLTRGTEGSLPLAPSGGTQGEQRGAYPWLLQGAHKGYRGEPNPGSFRGSQGEQRGAYPWLLQRFHRGNRAPRCFRNLTGGTWEPHLSS
jgi:hypothetical protein